jgi:hypothetical protein
MRTLLFALCSIALAAQAQQDSTVKTGSTSKPPTDPNAGASGSGLTRTPEGSQSDNSSSGGAQGRMPRPDPALTKAFGSSVGTWRCNGKMMLPKEMGGREVNTRSSMTIRKELGGFAYSGDWKSEKNEAFPGMQGKMTWTYDAGTKKLNEFSVDSVGDVMRGEAEASEDGKTVWNEEGTMMGKPSKTRTTVTMKGKNQLDLAFDAQGDSGWAPMGKESCTKGGG